MEMSIKKTIETEKELERKMHFLKISWVQSLISFLIIFGLLISFIFWQSEKSKVYIENAYLDAPIVNLTPTSSGVLNSLFVKEGDRIEANSQIAIVGSQIIYSKEEGVVSKAPLVLGSYFSPGQTVVSVVNNHKMRVVGEIEETKGLEDIKRGQKVIFTVDAFPKNEYEGIVEEVSPVSNDSGIVFSISDKRPVKKFNVYVSFDQDKYDDLKSGMSSKIWVYLK